MPSILPRVNGASPVTPEVAAAARQMLDELHNMKLTVAKIPGDPDLGRDVRCVICPNPEWYSRLCQQYLMPRPNRRWKRPRTIIRRVDVARTLKALSQGWRGSGTYFDRVLDAIDWWRQQAGDAS